ncbi:MAG: PadR family transcriptional regulator [Candidatus Aenigmatarchaeota archaeon]
MSNIHHTGFMKIIILRSLLTKPRHGYEIIKDLESCGCKTSAGTIYPILKSLEKEGAITKKIDGRKKVYTLTSIAKKTIKVSADPELMIIATRVGKKVVECWISIKKRSAAKRLLIEYEKRLDKILEDN